MFSEELCFLESWWNECKNYSDDKIPAVKEPHYKKEVMKLIKIAEDDDFNPEWVEDFYRQVELDEKSINKGKDFLELIPD